MWLALPYAWSNASGSGNSLGLSKWMVPPTKICLSPLETSNSVVCASAGAETSKANDSNTNRKLETNIAKILILLTEVQEYPNTRKYGNTKRKERSEERRVGKENEERR